MRCDKWRHGRMDHQLNRFCSLRSRIYQKYKSIDCASCRIGAMFWLGAVLQSSVGSTLGERAQ
eukprot:5722386-Ditylum_brightwellii.AAC.1